LAALATFCCSGSCRSCNTSYRCCHGLCISRPSQARASQMWLRRDELQAGVAIQCMTHIDLILGCNRVQKVTDRQPLTEETSTATGQLLNLQYNSLGLQIHCGGGRGGGNRAQKTHTYTQTRTLAQHGDSKCRVFGCVPGLMVHVEYTSTPPGLTNCTAAASNARCGTQQSSAARVLLISPVCCVAGFKLSLSCLQLKHTMAASIDREPSRHACPDVTCSCVLQAMQQSAASQCTALPLQVRFMLT
jgi:hypothetical protein